MFMSEMKMNKWTLGVLITLILLSALLAENSMNSMIYLIVLVSGVKFIIVIFQFVEAKHAHSFWKLISFLFVGVYLLGIAILSS